MHAAQDFKANLHDEPNSTQQMRDKLMREELGDTIQAKN